MHRLIRLQYKAGAHGTLLFVFRSIFSLQPVFRHPKFFGISRKAAGAHRIFQKFLSHTLSYLWCF